MTNKKCPQCKNLISSRAPTCLYCGRPNKFVTKDYINKKWNKDNNNKANLYNRIIFYRYLLFIFIFLITILIILLF